uniref:FYVE, RhoGEF and PH domain-containing protein 6-like n=1 Tax=Saccoglossus kowalevskii TaxID=10224 RepID=A0ABM0MPC1_SACKO
MKAFNVAQELMTSEKVFVGILELMNLHFRSAVNAANSRASKKIISQEDLNQILYYLPQLTEINQDLLSKLQDRIEKWETCPKISDIILGLCPFLKLYSTTYIKEFDRMTSTLEEQCKKSPQFATVVKEFERSEMCGKLQLRHHMLKPIQRIPQYKLLLQDYIKYLDDDSQEYTDSKRALKLVSEIASHCNNSMKQM